MIEKCPKCESKALDAVTAASKHEYHCRKCGTITKTVEVGEAYLRELVMAKLGHSQPATA